MDPRHKRLLAFVNNAQGWENFSEHLETLIKAAYSKVEAAKHTDEGWRQLCAIKALRTVRRLRDDLSKAK